MILKLKGEDLLTKEGWEKILVWIENKGRKAGNDQFDDYFQPLKKMVDKIGDGLPFRLLAGCSQCLIKCINLFKEAIDKDKWKELMPEVKHEHIVKVLADYFELYNQEMIVQKQLAVKEGLILPQ